VIDDAGMQEHHWWTDSVVHGEQATAGDFDLCCAHALSLVISTVDREAKGSPKNVMAIGTVAARV